MKRRITAALGVVTWPHAAGIGSTGTPGPVDGHQPAPLSHADRSPSGSPTTPRRRRGAKRWSRRGTPTIPTRRSPPRRSRPAQTSEEVIGAAITAGNARASSSTRRPLRCRSSSGRVGWWHWTASPTAPTTSPPAPATRRAVPLARRRSLPDAVEGQPGDDHLQQGDVRGGGLDPENPPLAPTTSSSRQPGRSSTGGCRRRSGPRRPAEFFQPWFDFYPMYIAQSGQQLVEDGEATFASEDGFAVADFWRTMYDEGLSPRRRTR